MGEPVTCGIGRAAQHPRPNRGTDRSAARRNHLHSSEAGVSESERDALQDALREAEIQIGELTESWARWAENVALQQELKVLDAEGEQLRRAQRQR